MQKSRTRIKHELRYAQRHARKWGRDCTLIPSPRNAQTGVVIGPKSDERMRDIWEGVRYGGRMTVQMRDYISRRATDDPTRQGWVAWKRREIGARAFRRLLRAELYVPGASYDAGPIRAVFARNLTRLGLNVEDVIDVLRKDSDIVGAHAGMGVVPNSHYESLFLMDVMGLNER